MIFLVLRELVSVSNYAIIRSRRCNYPNQWNTEFKVQMSELPVGKKGIMQHVIYPDLQNFHLLKETKGSKMWKQSKKVTFFMAKFWSKFQRDTEAPLKRPRAFAFSTTQRILIKWWNLEFILSCILFTETRLFGHSLRFAAVISRRQLMSPFDVICLT